MKKLFYTSIIFVCLTIYTNAQVGINLTNPSKHAALEINGQGTKGIVIPKMDYEMRHGLLEHNLNRPPEERLPQGLLVFDPNLNMFFFLNENEKEKKNEWIALNPLQASDENRGMLKISNNGSSANFADNVVVTGDIDVKGRAFIHGNANLGSLFSMEANISDINVNTINANNGNVKNLTATTGTINALNAKTLNATKGNGVIPIGGIIMWSGDKNSLPDGWALCDGGKKGGFTTPDLRGRFILGYGASRDDNGSGAVPTDVWDETYKNVGGHSVGDYYLKPTGGRREVSLSVNQIPSHNHYVRRDKHGNNSSGSGNDSSVGHYNATAYESLGNFNTSSTGGGAAHENRPPYYVLAFIMRVE